MDYHMKIEYSKTVRDIQN